jgi:hypothetical protein
LRGDHHAIRLGWSRGPVGWGWPLDRGPAALDHPLALDFQAYNLPLYDFHIQLAGW